MQATSVATPNAAATIRLKLTLSRKPDFIGPPRCVLRRMGVAVSGQSLIRFATRRVFPAMRFSFTLRFIRRAVYPHQGQKRGPMLQLRTGKTNLHDAVIMGL